MKKTDIFIEFYNEFVWKAGICQLSKDDWKTKLYDKLALVLWFRNNLFEKARDNNIIFKNYCQAAQQIDFDYQYIEMICK